MYIVSYKWHFKTIKPHFDPSTQYVAVEWANAIIHWSGRRERTARPAGRKASRGHVSSRRGSERADCTAGKSPSTTGHPKPAAAACGPTTDFPCQDGQPCVQSGEGKSGARECE